MNRGLLTWTVVLLALAVAGWRILDAGRDDAPALLPGLGAEEPEQVSAGEALSRADEARSQRSTRTSASPAGQDAAGDGRASLSVRVLGPEGPTVAARLSLVGPAGVVAWGMCDEDGRCTLDGLEPGQPFKVEILEPEFLKTVHFEPLALEPGEERELRYLLGEGLVLRGRLVDESGAAVPGRAVSLLRHRGGRFEGVARRDARELEAQMTVRTDGAGEFEFEYVGHGKWWIWPEGAWTDAAWTPTPGSAVPVATAIELPPGAARYFQALALEGGLAIAGTVLSQDGLLAPGVEVRATGVGELSWSEVVRSDELGAFSFDLLPDGDYDLVATFDGMSFLSSGDAVVFPSSFSRALDSKPLRARAGTRGVVIEMRREQQDQASLVGRVVSALEGRGLETGFELRRIDDTGLIDGTYLRTDAEGLIELTSLEPGSYVVIPHSVDGLFGPPTAVELRPGMRHVLGDLEMREGVELEVLVRGAAEGGALDIAWMGHVMTRSLGVEGEMFELRVPRGELELEWKKLDGTGVKARVDTTSGSAKRVTMQAP